MSQQLRILHCLRAPVGGLFRHVLDLAREQARRGHAVGIIADSNASDSLSRQKLAAIAPSLQLGLHLIPMSRTPGFGDVGVALNATRIAKRQNAGILHGHGAKGGAFARLAALGMKLSGRTVRCFYTPHGGSLHFDPSSLEGRIYLNLEKVLASLTDGIIFESQFSARVYSERIGLGGMPARIVPNGLTAADFEPHAPDADAADFLFVGELRNLKGVDVLLDALAMINRTRQVRAVIVGAGPDAQAFKSQAAALGLKDRVSFPGAMAARDAFALGRVLIVPSRAESFPYIVLEAGAAGLPLVATSVGGIPEIVAGSGMSLVPPGNAAELAAAMRSAIEAPHATHETAQRLSQEIARKFTVAAMTCAILSFQSAQPAAATEAVALT